MPLCLPQQSLRKRLSRSHLTSLSGEVTLAARFEANYINSRGYRVLVLSLHSYTLLDTLSRHLRYKTSLHFSWRKISMNHLPCHPLKESIENKKPCHICFVQFMPDNFPSILTIDQKPQQKTGNACTLSLWLNSICWCYTSFPVAARAWRAWRTECVPGSEPLLQRWL